MLTEILWLFGIVAAALAATWLISFIFDFFELKRLKSTNNADSLFVSQFAPRLFADDRGRDASR